MKVGWRGLGSPPLLPRCCVSGPPRFCLSRRSAPSLASTSLASSSAELRSEAMAAARLHSSGCARDDSCLGRGGVRVAVMVRVRVRIRVRVGARVGAKARARVRVKVRWPSPPVHSSLASNCVSRETRAPVARSARTSASSAAVC